MVISLLTLSEDISSRAFNLYWVLIDIRSSGGRGALTLVVWCHHGREFLCSIKSWRNGNVYVVSNYFRSPLNVFANCPGICLSKLPSITRCLPSLPPGPPCLHKSLKLPTWCRLMMDRAFVLLWEERRNNIYSVCPKLRFHLNLS